MNEQINVSPETIAFTPPETVTVPTGDDRDAGFPVGAIGIEAGPLAGPVLGEFVQTEDEVGAEVLAQEATVH